MVKLSMVLTFLLTLLATMGGAHALVWWRLVGQTQLPGWAAATLTAVLACGLAAIPLAMALTRRLPPGVAHVPLLISYGWLGSFFYLFLAVLAGCAVQAGLGAVTAALQLTPVASPLGLQRTLAVAAVVVAGVACALAWHNGRGGPRLRQVDVHLARLPAAFDGLRVVQLSDLHVAALLRRDYVETVVQMTLAAKPDLIVLTGDLVDGSVAQLREDIAPLARLRAPLGSYVITGNHEYYSGADAWLAHYAELGLVPLRNARTTLRRGDAAIDLAGIDDWTAHNFGPGHGADLAAALRGRDPARCLLLLAHQPRAAAEAEAAGVDLLLSGHTHGGQLWPFGYLVRLVQPFLRGLGRLGAMQVYVNPGTGYWGPPMRLGAPAEISLLVLRAGASASP